VTEGPGLRLQAVHQEIVGEPVPEWLEEASCGPSAKHLAHLAMHASETGQTAVQWRVWVHTHVPDVSPKLFAEAEECMRDAGLWPWLD